MISDNAINPRLRFLGAAGTVTGSKYLLTYGHSQILIDCGLFQGPKQLRLKNWDRFPIDPKSLDAIILTHAHIDHSGYIPRLIKEGFRGKVYCTAGTFELCRILLPDTGYLQEEEADYLNRKKFSKHSPALPLFTKKEAERALEYFAPQEFDRDFKASEDVEVKFIYAGHILGASQAIVQAGQTRIGFSGDLGRQNDPVFYPPAVMPQVDYLVVESTYGNRRHESSDPLKELGQIIRDAVQKKGVVMIPAFAVGRAQTLMYFLSQLRKAGEIPNIPMYLNSPMAVNATNLFCELKTLHKLSEKECSDTCDVVEYVKTVEESKALNEKKGPMVIISASGMATGGRILHHLIAFASDPNNTIVLAGFQAAGTRGRQIQDGAKEIKIYRDFIPVRASVRSLDNLSAHADYTEILKWLNESNVKPKRVFITHGEPDASLKLKEHLEHELKLNCQIPIQDEEFTLEPA